MRLLWLATKPPWPPRDGGRLLQKLTLEALAEAGVETTLVTPIGRTDDPGRLRREAPPGCALVPVRSPLRPRPVAAVLALARGLPLSIVRHRHRRVARRVAELAGSGRFDAVHVEQLQAWPQAAAARRAGLGAVLRQQNVESELWRALAERSRGLWARWARREAALLGRYEARTLRAASATVALTECDAASLRTLSGAEVEVVPAPFPGELPAGDAPLPGSPPLVVFGGGWLPNRDGLEWFLAEVWPAVARELPEALLHVFGGNPRAASPRVRPHPPPAESREAFAPGSLHLVPLRIASGVRMKVLEAWARGVAVVATPEAAAGLDAEDGREVLLARRAAEFVSALRRLRDERHLSAALVAAGRRALAERHDPGEVAVRLLRIYESLSV